MGFNTWNRWHCWVDEHKLRETADLMVKLGLQDAGYTYLNIDDCWQAERRAFDSSRQYNGTVVPDPSRFPSGLKAVADYIHSRGLRFGIYTAQHEYTCQLKTGSYQHEALDAATYCDAGVDYVKIDACGGAGFQQDNTSWIRFRRAFDECETTTGRCVSMACPLTLALTLTGRHITMACSSCSDPDGCGKWIATGQVRADVWRTTGDIQATWS